MPLRLVPLALLLGTSSALAFDTSKLGQWGSLFLDDLTPVIAKSARLQQEINEALSGANKKQEDVTCVGIRFPGQWKNLGPSSINAIPAILLEFVFFEFVFVMNVPTVNNIYGSVLIFLPACFFTWLAFRLHSLWARKRRMIDSGLVPP